MIFGDAFGDVLGERARLTPGRTALVDVARKRFSYAALDARAVHCARVLRQVLGFETDDRMAVLTDLAQEGGFGLDEIDFLIFTQVRKPSIELVMADLGLPMERTHTVMEDWGYTGSACVAMALHDARERGKIQPGTATSRRARRHSSTPCGPATTIRSPARRPRITQAAATPRNSTATTPA